MQLAPGVYSLGINKGFESHAYLIDDGTGLTLIDTLFDADARVILDQIRAIGRPITDLKHIVLTHAHRSHLGGAAALKGMSGATIYSHAWEADIMAAERVAQQVSWQPQDPIVTYLFQVGNNINISKHAPFKVDQYVEDGETVGPLIVVHTPGHTPGHLAFWLADPRILFCGDAVVTSPKFMAGWPAFTLNKRQHADSLYKLAAYNANILAFGHGEPITTDAVAKLQGLLPTV